MFISPNAASIMNSLPPEQRGAGSGMRTTFSYMSIMFSIIIFFTLLVSGITATMSKSIYTGLIGQGVSSSQALSASQIPPTSAIFAAFLGYNPLKTLLPQSLLSNLTVQQQDNITWRSFFPNLIAQPFTQRIKIVLYFAAALSLIAALTSAFRGRTDLYKT